MDAVSEAPLKVLMFPWLAYGHISPFLGLAKNLADRGFSIYLCSTPINLQSIKNKISQEYAESIHLVDFPLEETPDFPPHFHTTNGLPIHLHPTLRKAVDKAIPNLSRILDDHKPNLVIYDFHLPLIVGVTSRLNIPAVKLLPSCAAVVAYFLHLSKTPGIPFPFPEINLTDFVQARAIATIQACKKEQIQETDEQEDSEITTERLCDSITLLRSSRELEGKYIDYLSHLKGWKIFPFCSLLNGSFNEEGEDHELITWLGTKEESSSIFVSFGSELFLDNKDLEEIAMGLELSGVNFIWVVRFPKGSDDSIENSLPEGFIDRVGDKGRVVEGWAPQARILSHPSIGGFVSHCGWNSLMEAIETGTPIIGVPIHMGQPMNARLVVGLGVGVEVKRDGDGKVKREEIAAGIKQVVEGNAGEEARRKMQQLGQKLKDEEDHVLDSLAEMLKTISDAK